MKSFGDCEHVMVNHRHTLPGVVFRLHEQFHNYLRPSCEGLFPPIQADPYSHCRDTPRSACINSRKLYKIHCSGLEGLRIIEAQHHWRWTYFPLHLRRVEIAPSPPLLASLEKSMEMKTKPVPLEEWCTGLAAIEKLSFDPLLVFLGTSSSIPTEMRNVTGIYFNPNPSGHYSM